MLLNRRTPLALLNLFANPTRAIVSVSGVTFALLLIFVQLGFRGAVANTATIVYGRLKFDLLVRSTQYLHLYEPRLIDRSWLDKLEEHADIESIEPFWIMLNKWRSPSDGNFRAIGMMAVAPQANPLAIEGLKESYDRLMTVDDVLIDQATRADYGPVNGRRFGAEDIGREAELGGKRVRITGYFRLGTGLATNGAVIISDAGFAQRSGVDVRYQTSLGLVKLRKGIDPETACQSIRQWLELQDPSAPNSIQILSRREVLNYEHHRWLNETPIGIIFQMGAVLAFLVGAAIVYMVLAQDVAMRLPEYATLKAMGYSTQYVVLVVLWQAWLLAVVGFIPAAIMADTLYRLTASLAGIPISMNWVRLFGVMGLSLAMCTLSGFGAVRKLWQAEPAALF